MYGVPVLNVFCLFTVCMCACVQCEEYREGSLTGDMCEDLCVHGRVSYQRCLYYENGKKVIEARWNGSPVVLKSKLENFSSYEPLGLLEYQEPGEELSPLDMVFYATLEIRNSLGLEVNRLLYSPFYIKMLFVFSAWRKILFNK